MVEQHIVKKNAEKFKNKKYEIRVKAYYKEIPAEEFIATNPDYPDASRYQITYIVEDKPSFQGLMPDFYDDTEMLDAIIKELKKYHGIHDPWDDDPDYMKKKAAQYEVDYQKKVEQNLRDSRGDYYKLKINPACADQSSEEFVPEDPDYPNVYRYLIYTHDHTTGKEKIVYLKESYYRIKSQFKEDVVKRLKAIHGIHDPWDNNDLSEEWYEKNRIVFNAIAKRREEGKLPSRVTLGKNQVGERKEEIYLADEREEEMGELWRWWRRSMDRKVISWTEQVGEKDDRSILQDRQVILERKRGAGERAWRLVYQKWNRTYNLHDRQEKEWIGADHNSIMQYEEYEYEDNIKVRFKRKWFR